MALNSNALTTLATLKGELGLTDSSLDTVLERLINVASQAIEAECGRIFGSATVTERLPGSQGARLVLKQPPIASVTSISVDGSALDPTEYEIDDADAGLLFRAGGWARIAEFVTGIERDPLWGTEKNRWTVVYVGGWVLPTASSGRTLPADVEEACIITATSLFRRRGTDQGIAAESLGDASVTYAGRGIARTGGLPDAALALIDKYRRTW